MGVGKIKKPREDELMLGNPSPNSAPQVTPKPCHKEDAESQGGGETATQLNAIIGQSDRRADSRTARQGQEASRSVLAGALIGTEAGGGGSGATLQLQTPVPGRLLRADPPPP